MATMQVGGITTPPTDQDAVRADALMRRAWRGRGEAIRRICADQTRVSRLRVLDGTFSQAQQAYQRRFGILWQSQGVLSEGRLGAGYDFMIAGAVSGKTPIDPRCQSPAGFAGAFGEYQNGVTLALAELEK